MFSPYGYTLIDNGADETKPSILLHVTALTPTVVQVKSPEGEQVLDRAEKGDAFGIWYSAGMSALADLKGREVLMFQDGVKDVGRPKPMKVYKIFAKGGKQPPSRLPCLGDFRKKSKNASLPFQVELKGIDDEFPGAF